MPASHHIDTINKLVITEWSGNADIGKFNLVYQNYLKKIQNNPVLADYHEIVNLTCVKKVNYNFNDLKKFAKSVASRDNSESAKLAIIINSTSLYILVKGYIALRKISPQSKKQVKVFYDYFDALMWINKDATRVSNNHDTVHGIH